VKKILPVILVFYLIVCTGVVIALAVDWFDTGRAPQQPIAFSHPIHAGNLGLECTYCHQNAGRSPQATAPALSVCMDCHKNAALDRPEVQKLVGFWERKEAVSWNRVYELPWHVYFTHKRHISAGVDCSHCHGELKAQSTVRRVRSLDMGWCVSCHRSRQAPTDCWTCHK
jgi:hypothetical protein